MRRIEATRTEGLWKNNPLVAYIIEEGDTFASIWDIVAKEGNLGDTAFEETLKQVSRRLKPSAPDGASSET